MEYLHNLQYFSLWNFTSNDSLLDSPSFPEGPSCTSAPRDTMLVRVTLTKWQNSLCTCWWVCVDSCAFHDCSCQCLFFLWGKINGFLSVSVLLWIVIFICLCFSRSVPANGVMRLSLTICVLCLIWRTLQVPTWIISLWRTSFGCLVSTIQRDLAPVSLSILQLCSTAVGLLSNLGEYPSF